MTSSTEASRAARSCPARDLERHAGVGERALGPDDALGDRRRRDEEGARDLLGRQPPEQAQRQRHPRLGREDRMAGREEEAQQVVADVVVDRGLERRDFGFGRGLEIPGDLPVLALEERPAAKLIDRAVLRRRHEPGAGVLRHARLGPPLERRDQGVLREVLGETDVPDDPREPRDEPRRLDSPDGVDRAVRIRGRHGPGLEHLRLPAQFRGPDAQSTIVSVRSHRARRSAGSRTLPRRGPPETAPSSARPRPSTSRSGPRRRRRAPSTR